MLITKCGATHPDCDTYLEARTNKGQQYELCVCNIPQCLEHLVSCVQFPAATHVDIVSCLPYGEIDSAGTLLSLLRKDTSTLSEARLR